MNPERTEKFLATLATEGVFKGSINRGVVTYRSSLSPPIEKTEYESSGSSTQAIKSPDKIKKLEELYREGKIDELAYRKLKEEYEKEGSI